MQKFRVVSLAARLVFSWWCLPFLLRPSPLPVLGDFLVLFMLFMAGQVMWPLVTVMDMAMNGANLIKGIGWTDRMAASLLPALMIMRGSASWR